MSHNRRMSFCSLKTQLFLLEFCCSKQIVHMLTNIIQMLLHFPLIKKKKIVGLCCMCHLYMYNSVVLSLDIVSTKRYLAVLVFRYYVATKFKAL